MFWQINFCLRPNLILIIKMFFTLLLKKALLNFFKLKFSIESSDLSKQRIKKILEDQNTDPSIIDLFLKLIENCSTQGIHLQIPLF